MVAARSALTANSISEIYRRLFACFGPQRWWPGETPFEVMVGAILTQSASWHNVEMAIGNLKRTDALSPKALREIPMDELARLIHSSGYYNAKTKKLKAMAEWLGKYGDNLDKAFADNLDHKREELLAIHGIGLETADSILLYASEKPFFVIDAYTRRIIERFGIAPDKDSYDAYQKLFMSNLEQDARLFNEYHALLVKLGKDVCRKKPLCPVCCLKDICVWGRKHS
jgi:endonuclease III related protein